MPSYQNILCLVGKWVSSTSCSSSVQNLPMSLHFFTYLQPPTERQHSMMDSEHSKAPRVSQRLVAAAMDHTDNDEELLRALRAPTCYPFALNFFNMEYVQIIFPRLTFTGESRPWMAKRMDIGDFSKSPYTVQREKGSLMRYRAPHRGISPKSQQCKNNPSQHGCHSRLCHL